MANRSMLWRSIIGISIITITIFGTLAFKNHQEAKKIDESRDEHPFIGKVFPDYGLETEDGETVDFASGKPMMVMFFASWCPYCDESIDNYMDFTDERGDINAVLINMHHLEDSESDAEKLMEEKDPDFPVLYDNDETYAKTFQVESVPLNVILDEDGVIVDIINGTIPPEDLEELFPKG